MKKKILALISSFVIVLLGAKAYAAGGSVYGSYGADNEKVPGVSVELYRLADYEDGNGKWLISDERNISSMTNSELGDWAAALATQLDEPLISTNTAEDGSFGFDNLGDGIYLVKFLDLEDDNIKYEASPIVLSLPDSELSRKLDLHVKYKRVETPVDEPDEPNESTPPPVNTLDEIMKYILIFVASVIVLVLVNLVAKKIKKGENDEKN